MYTLKYTLPITSEALKAVIKITGIHDPSLQEIISDIIPGYKQSVTKYANPILPMYGNIIFATSNLASKPSKKSFIVLLILFLKRIIYIINKISCTFDFRPRFTGLSSICTPHNDYIFDFIRRTSTAWGIS